MMKYPIGIQSFAQLREDGFVYVDKTQLLYRLVTEGKIYFLSRPRRFGKSLLVSTLKAYFQGRKDLFQGLALEELEKEWAEYPVFHVDFNGEVFTEKEALKSRLESYVTEWERMYGKIPSEASLGNRFAYVLRQAHLRTGRRCVVLIDEYDKPILDVLDTNFRVWVDGQEYLLEDRNRELLKGFYSVFKAADEDLRFVLLTGVTKFSQVSVFSGFNQPADLSMDPRYEALCGITQEELERYFAEPIGAMAAQEGIPVEEMMSRLKRQYDGYHFSPRLTDVYNPFSLLNAFASGLLMDYWFRSGTPTYLLRLLAHSNENLNEMTGRYYDPQEFIDYKATVEKPLPMIYQSGYLTIKDCDREFGTYLLDFPNNEVKKGFLSLVANDYFKPEREGTESWVRTLVRERERYFHYTFYLIFRLVSVYAVYTEKQQSEGRVDCIVETPHYVYIFEFKLDGTADEALRQIAEKGYARPYEAEARTLFCIGVGFSSQSGTVADWKVERGASLTF